MSKKITAVALSLVLILLSLVCGINAFASTIDYTYDEDSQTLTILGTGAMENYADEYSTPWVSYADTAVNLIISSGITSIGDYSFSGFSKLTAVTIADSVKSVGNFSFASCDALNTLALPSSVTSIADSSFAYIGTVKKENFTLNAVAGSYALYYAITNSVNFDCESVTCGDYTTVISPKGMIAYYPYTAKVDGTFTFSSSGGQNPYGALYDSEFNLISYQDDQSDSNLNFSITAQLEKGKTYYFAAKLVSMYISGRFTTTLEAVSYTVSGTAYAMNDPSTTASDIALDNVYIDGELSSDGTYTFTADATITKTFEYENQVRVYTFTPDEQPTVTFVAVDLTGDGYVNAKDYALLNKNNSKYISLFKNFINYTIV